MRNPLIRRERPLIPAARLLLLLTLLLLTPEGSLPMLGAQTPSPLPFTEGSEEEKAFIEALEEFSQSRGLSIKHRKYQGLKNQHSFSSLTEVTLPGKKEKHLILVFPISNLTARQSATPDMGFTLLQELSQEELPCRMTFLFAGAEINRPVGKEALGSQLFLKDFSPQEATAVITFLNESAPPSGQPSPPPSIQMVSGSQGYTAPAWWFSLLLQNLSAETPDPLYSPGKHIISRLGLSSEAPQLKGWLEERIPAIQLITTEGRRLPLKELILQTAGQDWESHSWDDGYLLFPEALPGPPVISEFLMIQTITITMAILLLFLFTLPRFIRHNLVRLLKRIWIIPFFFLLSFIILTVSTVFLRSLLILRDFPDLWKINPPLFFILKVNLAILLFSLSYPLLRRFQLSRSGSFYSFSAAITATVNSLVMMFFDIAVALPLMVAVVMITLFAATRNRKLKVLFFLLSPLGVIIYGVIIFSHQDLSLISLLLISPMRGNAFLTLVLLPFLLLQSSLHFSHPQGENHRPRLQSLFITAGWGITAMGLMAYITLFSPYPHQSQPLTLTDKIHNQKSTREISISSPAPLPELTLKTGTERFRISGGPRSRRFTPALQPRMVRSLVSAQPFLDRQTLSITLIPWGNPDQIQLTLHTPDKLVLYEANFPYEVLLDQKRAELFVGPYPPNPLEITLSLAKIDELTLEALFIYEEPLPYPLEISPRTYPLRKEIIYQDSFPLLPPPYSPEESPADG